MKFFWNVLIVLEVVLVGILLRHWWIINAKKAKLEIISYRERLKFRKTVSLCSVLILGGIISALIVIINL